jgi:hypothetical protein
MAKNESMVKVGNSYFNPESVKARYKSLDEFLKAYPEASVNLLTEFYNSIAGKKTKPETVTA